MNCKICKHIANPLFTARVMQKYYIRYFRCSYCGYVFTEKPFWLKEAYINPINISDTGILARNQYFKQIVAALIFSHFDKHASFLDYSGGYGIFTRLMRDMGFDYYWDDPMTKNIFAKTFEYHPAMKIELLTAFECFEHFENPILELEKMLKISKNILFSTEIINEGDIDKNWWYFGFDHGQHISFYSENTFNYLAAKYQFNYYNLGGLGLLTEKNLNMYLLKFVRRYPGVITYFISKRMKSLTIPDMNSTYEKH